jgi:hypothetical protein
VSDIDPETDSSPETGIGEPVSRASGLGFLVKREAMIFDNKIDWVTRLKRSLIRREARRVGSYLQTRLIQGRAHAMSYCKLITQASVQVRRVSLGVRLGSA